MRQVLMLLDAAMISSLVPRPTMRSHLTIVLNRGTRLFDKTVSWLGLASRVTPGISAVVEQTACTFDRFPVVADCVRLVHYGSNASVYLLEHGSERIALKVYRDSFGLSREALIRSAAHRRRQYDALVGWYRQVAEVVLPSSFFVIHGPLLAWPVVASMQPFIDTDGRDLFGEISIKRLLHLAVTNESFRSQLVGFAETTARLFERGGPSIDLTGPENVFVIGQGDSCRLVVVDPGVVDLQRMRSHLPERYAEFSERVCRLQKLGRLARRGSAGRPC
jgi:hypothetical protein